jgi:hypothetical protein
MPPAGATGYFDASPGNCRRHGSGGMDIEVSSSTVQIFRRKGISEMVPIAVDYDAVIGGSAPDPQILADDVILVPTSSAKWLVKRFVGSLIGGIGIESLIHGT